MFAMLESLQVVPSTIQNATVQIIGFNFIDDNQTTTLFCKIGSREREFQVSKTLLPNILPLLNENPTNDELNKELSSNIPMAADIVHLNGNISQIGLLPPTHHEEDV